MNTVHISSAAQQQLKSLGVEAFYLFGSRALGVETPRSDFDFGVLMKTTGHKRGGEIYDALYDILSPLCERTLQNDVIDIVFLRDAPLELRAHIVRKGKVIFDESPLSRVNFEDKTIMEYCDYKPVLQMFDKAILASL